MPALLRYAWAAPATLVGLGLTLLAWGLGARLRIVDGVLEVAEGRLATLTARLPGLRHIQAITFGHVVLGRSHPLLADLRVHEHTHVRQYERWGLLFFPLYLGSSMLVWLRGGHPYLDNVFEREARAKEGL